MKKLLLFASLLLCFFSNVKADDNISASLKVESDLTTATLHVNLTNSASYVAFQMDIALPSGWTVTSADPVATSRLDGDGTVDLSSVGGSATESTKFILAYNLISSNTIRVIGYNLGNKPISLEAGELFSVALTKTAGTASAVTDWTATFANVEFVTESTLSETPITVANSGQVVGEDAWTLGDVNHDGSVTATDAVAVVKYILQGNDADKYKEVYGVDIYPEQADVNEDSNVTITDAILIAKLALK